MYSACGSITQTSHQNICIICQEHNEQAVASTPSGGTFSSHEQGQFGHLLARTCGGIRRARGKKSYYAHQSEVFELLTQQLHTTVSPFSIGVVHRKGAVTVSPRHARARDSCEFRDRSGEASFDTLRVHLPCEQRPEHADSVVTCPDLQVYWKQPGHTTILPRKKERAHSS